METNTGTTSLGFNILSWIFGVLFFIAGVLNLFLVHPVPGIFYLLLSLVYIPQIHTIFKKRFGFAIPLTIRIIVGFVILWGTLAVGDLAEILGL